MGFQYEFNWILKISDLDELHLQSNHQYPFVKKGARIYPLGMPIDLINGNWEAVARSIIDQITITPNETLGEYKVIEIYDTQKRKMLTEQWRTLLKISKNMPNIDDFSQVHIT